MKYVFSGHSDDVFMGGPEKEDDETSEGSGWRLVTLTGEGCVVRGFYSPGDEEKYESGARFGWGCWNIGVSPLDEDISIPEHWKFSYEVDRYTARLTIDVDEEYVVFSKLRNDDDE